MWENVLYYKEWFNVTQVKGEKRKCEGKWLRIFYSMCKTDTVPTSQDHKHEIK